MSSGGVYWCCLSCDLVGDTDRSAEQHTKRTQHTTMTSADPGRLAVMRDIALRNTR